MILRRKSIAISFRYLRHRLFVPFFRPAKSRVPIKGNPDFKPAPTALCQSLLRLIFPSFPPQSSKMLHPNRRNVTFLIHFDWNIQMFDENIQQLFRNFLYLCTIGMSPRTFPDQIQAKDQETTIHWMFNHNKKTNTLWKQIYTHLSHKPSNWCCLSSCACQYEALPSKRSLLKPTPYSIPPPAHSPSSMMPQSLKGLMRWMKIMRSRDGMML